MAASSRSKASRTQRVRTSPSVETANQSKIVTRARIKAMLGMEGSLPPAFPLRRIHVSPSGKRRAAAAAIKFRYQRGL